MTRNKRKYRLQLKEIVIVSKEIIAVVFLKHSVQYLAGTFLSFKNSEQLIAFPHVLPVISLFKSFGDSLRTHVSVVEKLVSWFVEQMN